MVLLQISWRKGFEDSRIRGFGESLAPYQPTNSLGDDSKKFKGHRNPPVDDAALSKIPLAGRCGEVYPPLEGE